MKAVLLLALGISVFLGVPTKTVQARSALSKPMSVDETQVDKWMQSWKKRLSLQDWVISTVIVRSTDLKPDTLGNLKWNSENKTAIIRVLNPADYDIPAGEIAADIEYTVVHELVHLQLAGLPRDASTKNVEEQVVNRIAEALMSLDKGAQYRSRNSVSHGPSKVRLSSEASRAQ